MTDDTRPQAGDAAPAHAPGTVAELDADAFAHTIPHHPFAIVDFWAPWCAPCRAFAPVFTEAAKKHPDVLFAKVNTEEQQALAAHFNIRSIPTLMIFRENVIIFAQPGALSGKALEEVLTAAGKLDMNEVRRELDATNKPAAGDDQSNTEGPSV